MKHHDRLRSLRLVSCAMIATISFFIISTSHAPCLVSAQEIDTVNDVMDNIMELLCFTPCDNRYTGYEVLPGTKCQWYHYCSAGAPSNRAECGDGLWFNPERGYCDIQPANGFINCPADPECPSTRSPAESLVVLPPTSSPEESFINCPTDPKCPSTRSPAESLVVLPPSSSPEESPTLSPEHNPTLSTEKNPTTLIQIPFSPGITPAPYSYPPIRQPISTAPTIGTAIGHIQSKRDLIESNVLISYDASGMAYPSTQYTMNGLMQSLKVMAGGFGADFKFMLWEGDAEKYIHGLVNLAAFLANAMVESIEYDSCDELNWQNIDGKHAISNSCGQEGRSYQDENCPWGSTEFLSCDVDDNMQVTAVRSGNQLLAPPPLKCKAGSGEDVFTGYWDEISGRLITDAPFPNVAERTDIEGCCWWGRGALSTRGVCNIGKLNYYLGKRGADLGRSTLYPQLDFCKYPEVTCTSAMGEQLRWTTALFEWSERRVNYSTNIINISVISKTNLTSISTSEFKDTRYSALLLGMGGTLKMNWRDLSMVVWWIPMAATHFLIL